MLGVAFAALHFTPNSQFSMGSDQPNDTKNGWWYCWCLKSQTTNWHGAETLSKKWIKMVDSNYLPVPQLVSWSPDFWLPSPVAQILKCDDEPHLEVVKAPFTLPPWPLVLNIPRDLCPAPSWSPALDHGPPHFPARFQRLRSLLAHLEKSKSLNGKAQEKCPLKKLQMQKRGHYISNLTTQTMHNPGKIPKKIFHRFASRFDSPKMGPIWCSL